MTEATLHESVVTLTLSSRTYARIWNDIRDAVVVSGIRRHHWLDHSWHHTQSATRKSPLELEFDGDIDTDATLTFSVGADAIAGIQRLPRLPHKYPSPQTLESVVDASTLIEATLHKSIVTLTFLCTYRKSGVP